MKVSVYVAKRCGPPNEEGHRQIDVNVLAEVVKGEVREEEQDRGTDDEREVVGGTHEPEPLPGQALGRHAETAPVEG